MLRDVSRSGSVLVYDHKEGYNRRQDFVWVLFKNTDIVFTTRAGSIFRIRVLREASDRTEHLERLEKFLTVGRVTADAPASKKLIGHHNLDLGGFDETATCSLPQASLLDPLYHFIKELGSGSFGTVHKAVNLSTGFVYAAKKFVRCQNILQEIGLLKSASHVRVP